MAITSGWKDTIDNIIYPTDYCRWDDLGDGANHYHTITAMNSPTVNSTGLNFSASSTAYVKVDYTNSLKLHDRSAWTIEFGINILTDGSSTTNYQTANIGWVIAQGEGDSSTTQNWAVFVDSDNQINFKYKTSTGATSFTHALLKLFNDQVEKIKITFDGTTIKIFKNDVQGVTHTINSAGILTDTADLVVGGNSTGDYQLLSARITELRIRKDEYTSDTLSSSSQNYLIEAAQENPSDNANNNVTDNWDIDTLIYLPIASNSNLKPRQLKKIPSTWEDYTRWFVAPAINIDATTSTIDFNVPIKGYRNVQIQTTDGFVYPFNAGATVFGTSQNLPYWGGQDSYGATMHGQGGNINFVCGNSVNELFNGTNNQAKIQEFTTMSQQFIIPSKGYLPEEEKTESVSMLDTTKVDTTSAKAKYNQGFRPRGIVRGTVRLGRDFITESMIQNSQDDSHVMGMPYWDTTAYAGATVQEGGIYSAGQPSIDVSSTGLYDTDFRYNEAVVHINEIGTNSVAQAEVVCRDNHNLSTGDQVFVRPGQHLNHQGNYSGYLKKHSLSFSRDYMALAGKKYVQVVSDTVVILFHDLARANPVLLGNGATADFRFGYLQRTTTLGNWIQHRNRHIAHYKQPFTSFYSITSGNNASILDHTDFAEGNDLSISQSNLIARSMDTDKPLLNLPNKQSWLYRGDIATFSNRVDVKSTPAGSAADPIVINSASSGFVSNSIGEEGAPVYLDIDTKFTGTLKFTVTNIETADSSVPSNIEYQYILNGEGSANAQPFNTGYNAWGSQAYDYNGTTHTASSSSTVSISVGYGSGQTQDAQNQVLHSIALKVWLPDVVHAGTGEMTRATYTIWFENNASATQDNVPAKLFYGGGLQPGRTITGTIGSFNLTNLNSAPIMHRSRHYIHYQVAESNTVPDPTVEIDIKGIPMIGYSGSGETIITGKDNNALMVGADAAQNYSLPYIQEDTSSATGPYNTGDIAPWVEQTTQTKDLYRLHAGKRYKCLVTHTSSKTFNTDFDAGNWELQ